MKNFILALFLSFSVSSFAQSWAAPGATWYYDLTIYAMPFPQYGYERIQNIGDTIIGTHQYNKLQIFRSWYNPQAQQTTNYTLPQLEFTRADSGVVYYYRDSAEYVLYNFNAQPGETWVLRNEFEWTQCDTASVVVDSIATTIINGDTLRVLRTSPVSFNGISFLYPRIIEKIGSLANLLPYTLCVTDIPQGYNLRCYSDSTGWTYHNPYWTYACDDLLGMHDVQQQQFFTLYQDMQSQTITLSGSQIQSGSLIQIYDSRGLLVQQMNSQNSGSTVLNVAGLPSGIYYVSVTSGNSFASKPFILNR